MPKLPQKMVQQLLSSVVNVPSPSGCLTFRYTGVDLLRFRANISFRSPSISDRSSSIIYCIFFIKFSFD